MDSIIANHKPSKHDVTNQEDLDFWKQRVDSMPESFVNLEKYASALAGRFHIYGDINDLRLADSIMQKLSAQYKEAGYLLSLAGYKMLQHGFQQAKMLIDSVIEMKAENYAAQMMLFDASFELGYIYQASLVLKNNYAPANYAYNFRLSKLDHYNNNWDSAVSHMIKASVLSHSNIHLKTAALSNAADLYLHNGNVKMAAELYKQCLQLNSSHFHSLFGLAWIALVHDGNVSVSKKMFEFLSHRSKLPDVFFKLYQALELTDPALAKQYAQKFAAEVSKSVYGNMYNNYLVHVYTGILNDPSKAVEIARREIDQRPTSQAYALLAWSLLCNGQKNEAVEMYKNYVSGKALQARELYWMGKLMKATGKAYNAKQFFKAARKNKYDLSPHMLKDLNESL